MNRTVESCIEQATQAFRKGKLPQARREAEYLVADWLHIPPPMLFLRRRQALEPVQARTFAQAIRRRVKREPLAYITSQAGFYGRMFHVTPNVLIPRPETEGLVEWALEWIDTQKNPVRVADIGTGSGCIAVSVAQDPQVAEVYAVDLSPSALQVARRNAETHQVLNKIRFRQGNLAQPLLRLGPSIDLLLANLPYVKSGEMAGLQKEVQKEPRLALEGGKDGLDLIRRLLKQAPRVLRPGGQILLELGQGQWPAVRNELSQISVWKDIEVRKDLAGIPRVVGIRSAMNQENDGLSGR